MDGDCVLRPGPVAKDLYPEGLAMASQTQIDLFAAVLPSREGTFGGALTVVEKLHDYVFADLNASEAMMRRRRRRRSVFSSPRSSRGTRIMGTLLQDNQKKKQKEEEGIAYRLRATTGGGPKVRENRALSERGYPVSSE